VKIAILLLLICVNCFGAVRWEKSEITYSDNCPRRFKDCVDSCFKQWGDASGLTFTRAKRGDIQIIWSKDKRLGDYISFSSISFSLESIRSATITINARAWRWHLGAPYGTFLRYDRKGIGELTGVVLHEGGHALGLFEHSSDPDDTMFYEIHPGSETLSDGDIAAIRSLYR
jgi:predicted Zn-dependent protease